jgi:hypothetical protein
MHIFVGNVYKCYQKLIHMVILVDRKVNVLINYSKVYPEWNGDNNDKSILPLKSVYIYIIKDNIMGSLYQLKRKLFFFVLVFHNIKITRGIMGTNCKRLCDKTLINNQTR